MLIQVIERITENDFARMEHINGDSIELDLSQVAYLTSKELSRLLIVHKNNDKPKICLLHAKDSIKKIIEILPFKDVFIIKG